MTSAMAVLALDGDGNDDGREDGDVKGCREELGSVAGVDLELG